MSILKCIAVDDEPLALGLVCAFIDKTPFLSLEGRYSSAVEALQYIQNQQADILFLDIQMPDLTGIELARILEKSGTRAPRIIFTTAFNQYALDGFRVDALDYLLKPFNYEEFLRAASRAQAYVELLQKASSAGPAEPKDEYLFLKVEYQLLRIAYDDILYMEGLKDYVKVHLKSDSKPVLSLTSLKALEEKLPVSKFMRVHRSFIVNLDKISAVTRNTIQIGTITIPVSDQYKEGFSQFLSKWM
ncbi:LytR/AlgR family response regulator transcription factor [Dyadobacter sediminis]|uniref:Response regulator transcription factor n=1 Tax=Dyadobacter sediminis TaxID=1493691 RepID=A0A5R9K2Y6_9BACT|nr:LytTR family DNA-binding domain-containing protein [Dyadobacter sediminis]TLU88807.1 response regulator transcription factor [Dyadobacter sediminis]GGC13327.1 DNA-binding response regulator [Dyadobacter sediminis]